MTLFWFGILAIFILMLTKGMGLSTVLLLSAALVASVRVTAYVSEKLSQDLAKMLPFTLLALSLTQPEFFSVEVFLEGLSQIPSLISKVPYYLVFIVAIELIMRFVNLIERMFNFESEKDAEKKVMN